MEIIHGGLDDISASSEQTGSRVSSLLLPHSDRRRPASLFALELLAVDSVDLQGLSNSEDNAIGPCLSLDADGCDADADDKGTEDPKLQRAIEEMERLDAMLYTALCKEKEVKRQRRKQNAQIWQELLASMPEGRSECAHEALNTRLFWALGSSIGPEQEDEFVSVFKTQVPDIECDRERQHVNQSGYRPDSRAESFEAGAEETDEKQFEGRHCGASKGKQKQKDFVKRNIELVSGKGGQVLLTQAERERLAELLQETDEEEKDSARGTDSEVHNSGAGLKYENDLQSGEKVLQDIRERREQERRLQKIQQQLEILGQSQDMTNESPHLSEEQLFCLLNCCELTELEPGPCGD